MEEKAVDTVVNSLGYLFIALAALKISGVSDMSVWLMFSPLIAIGILFVISVIGLFVLSKIED
jgi:hypothetical protein